LAGSKVLERVKIAAQYTTLYRALCLAPFR